MSNALALAGVTAVLRDMLNEGLIAHNVSGALGTAVTVSVLPPDRVVPAGGVGSTQLNLFLHRVTANAGWRNEHLPSRDGSGRNRLSTPPLALDLHYLLSAHGIEELQAEILLGYAMQFLHETPVLDRRAITNALHPPSEIGETLPPAMRALSDCGLGEQVEQIRITPESLNTEELSKLWTAAQTNYRPTAAYLASVVLIEAATPLRATLPVLSRGPLDPATGRDRGVSVQASLLAPYPTIQSVTPRDLQPAAAVTRVVDVRGHHLAGADRTILLSSARLQIEEEVAAAPGVSDTQVEFVVPPLPVGTYQLGVRVRRAAEPAPRTSNHLPLAIGPTITSELPATVARDENGRATITLTCRPDVRRGQRASLLLGTREVIAEPITTATGTLTFVCEAVSPGDHLVRLRVDGIESPIVNRAATPPAFFDFRITIT